MSKDHNRFDYLPDNFLNFEVVMRSLIIGISCFLIGTAISTATAKRYELKETGGLSFMIDHWTGRVWICDMTCHEMEFRGPATVSNGQS